MQGTPELEPLRTRIYIDGYNFYYGCLRRTPYKWLDLLPLFEKHILPSALVKDGDGRIRQSTLLTSPSIKFFTANILESVARAPDSVSSQARYHTALRKLHDGRIELIEGYYAVNKMKVKIVDAEHPDRTPRECQEIQAWKVEEKQSDVNLALQAYHDAITGQIDHAVIVTNDTDIAPALQMIRVHTNVLIGVVVPTTDHTRLPNTDLVKLAHWKREYVNASELAACQLPRVIPGRKPTIKPESWYGQPELLREILDLAIPVRGSKAAAFKWMDQHNPYLDNERPIELAESVEGANRVLEYIRNYIAQRAQAPDEQNGS
ncbi:6-hydroxy-3-succinoylpyridine 3-monooxygenase [Pseudomonas syringae]|uniref:6-hydroxy-3-succinoylpyridine hydroxylase n=2 Tax=Pseudomonas syringae TaxID=317 RepID=A0A1S6YB41_PSESY|nr:6-hydroxy-3-succinoylpyridine 3-monooxygenase [Pseudomonas syringae]ALE01104.1 6-hydroxy-3-succinoylpyridine hydroxylase NicB [Pseudomonas syringae UMAF0158]AQX42045.1 6-hydroxy-3-succinoylpyridine hydroxylase [Pseudomonas syringae pv. syringae]AQX42110.1 6-hydroxy-3-succinoylpyridine hydroxylase [Pseudomonas syringae pv. syringae]MCK9694772.1 6-hydroxy-3-succinoylpyridine 3-monooxygenase [Pseudomonas syringae pv. syringae]MCK9709734.1 6-hydroxy-3-succinoylpyridine 3-monooxygenase [Pseudomo